MQLLGLGNLLTKIIEFLIYVTEDIFLTFIKYLLEGFTHFIMDTLKYMSDFVLHIARLYKR
ncbi:hypothetical protein [Acidianus bottle-shaped virus 3 strain ABV3]|uniref:Uncharacterized protein n=1 Tax=Acidianus bottle-shaped virus 3 strain ABV3 TaxID=1732174 RepID=A0A0N7FYX5_9VIRU|nr:hypothetical protein AVU00_gp34 [Acidianus bottle-shaped virus 3 strain ABV3]ALG96836.1 hypothetical protein [Acidianus bottle-shaped virus 3 strain ABV3]